MDIDMTHLKKKKKKKKKIYIDWGFPTFSA